MKVSSETFNDALRRLKGLGFFKKTNWSSEEEFKKAEQELRDILITLEKDGEERGVYQANKDNYGHKLPEAYLKGREDSEKLIEAYKEYVDLLSGYIADNASFLMIHGHKAPEKTIERGKELRKKIEEISNKES